MDQPVQVLNWQASIGIQCEQRNPEPTGIRLFALSAKKLCPSGNAACTGRVSDMDSENPSESRCAWSE